ncbi:MAG: UDP-N-acetylmuramoyl-tripeptide--D-alanyl-D-alanine ligase [Alphaproteobacteria bacterium]
MMRAPLWTSEDATDATGGRPTGRFVATGVSIDSRTVEPGDLFVAIKGPNLDGHDFLAQAFARGAAGAIVSHKASGLPDDAPHILVGDTLTALNDLARAARRRTRAAVVAITGSVGKTGTKEFLALALAEQGKTAASAGNLNNQWGAPLSLARLPADARFGVFELGMNHAGEIAPLSRLVQPDVAIITTIAAVHMAHFPSTFAIAEAKGEIFEGMAGGTAVLNRDNAYFPFLACLACCRGVERIIGFGAHPEAKARLEHATFDAEGSTVGAVVAGEKLSYRLSIPGRQWAINSLAVLGAVKALGADVATAAARLSSFEGFEGRGRRHRVDLEDGSFEVIDESYNASPISMRAALEILATARPGRGGRRIAVLGDMLELGPNSSSMHAALAETIRRLAIDIVFTAGHDMAVLDRTLPRDVRGAHCETSDELARIIVGAIRPGDVVAVKGSHGVRMDRVVDALLRAGHGEARH